MWWWDFPCGVFVNIKRDNAYYILSSICLKRNDQYILAIINCETVGCQHSRIKRNKETYLQYYIGRDFHEVLVSAWRGNLYSVWNPFKNFSCHLKWWNLLQTLSQVWRKHLQLTRDHGTKPKVEIRMQNHSIKKPCKTNKSCFQME